MLSGLLLWQTLNHSGLSGRLGLNDRNGWRLWFAAALVVVFLWVKVFPRSLRFFSLLMLLNWPGKLYVTNLELSGSWPLLLEMVFSVVRYLGILGIAVTVWFILFRNRNILERKYTAAALYFLVMHTFLLFKTNQCVCLPLVNECIIISGFEASHRSSAGRAGVS